MPVFHWTLSLGDLVLASAILTLGGQIGKTAKKMYAPIHRFVDEHNTLWADYEGRTAGGYLQRRDRELYKVQAVAYRPEPYGASTSRVTGAKTEGLKSND